MHVAGAAPRVPPGVKNLTRSKNVGRAKASVGQGVGRAKAPTEQKRRQGKAAVERRRRRSKSATRSKSVGRAEALSEPKRRSEQPCHGANIARRECVPPYKKEAPTRQFRRRRCLTGGIIGKVRWAGRSLPLKASVASRGRFSRGRCLPGGANDKWFYIKMDIN